MTANDSHLTSTYIATIDADITATNDALLAIDPMSSLATRLAALGLDDQAVWVESAKTSPTGTHGAAELGFSLLWRFGPPGQTAKITWRIRLSKDGLDRTVLSVAIRAQASDDAARERITAGWPIVETITLEHARSLRRALDEYAADQSEIKQPRRLTALSADA
jgi:hypothetical protein